MFWLIGIWSRHFSGMYDHFGGSSRSFSNSTIDLGVAAERYRIEAVREMMGLEQSQLGRARFMALCSDQHVVLEP